MPPQRRPKAETIDVGNSKAEMAALLRHYAERVATGQIEGLMVIAETSGGGYELKMTSSENVAERLGRLVLLQDAVIEAAEDS